MPRVDLNHPLWSSAEYDAATGVLRLFDGRPDPVALEGVSAEHFRRLLAADTARDSAALRQVLFEITAG